MNRKKALNSLGRLSYLLGAADLRVLQELMIISSLLQAGGVAGAEGGVLVAPLKVRGMATGVGFGR